QLDRPHQHPTLHLQAPGKKWVATALAFARRLVTEAAAGCARFQVDRAQDVVEAQNALRAVRARLWNVEVPRQDIGDLDVISREPDDLLDTAVVLRVRLVE